MVERAPPPRHGITRAAVIGSIAQLVERLAHIEEVGGSIPSGPTPHLSGGIAHWQGPPSRKWNFIQATSRHERSTRHPLLHGEIPGENPAEGAWLLPR